MTLHFHNSGPLMKYDKGLLHISDLNPEIHTKWRMSRLDMFKLGWKCILSALRH